MFAELIFTSLLATGGVPETQAQTPRAEHAVIRHTEHDRGRAQGANLHLAADLGRPYYPESRRPYHERGYNDYSSPYHGNRPYHQGRYYEESYPGDNSGRYSDPASEPFYGEDYRSGYPDERYEAGPRGPRDRLIDPQGRPYPYAAEPGRPDAPAYRRGAYDRPGPDFRPGPYRGLDAPRPPYEDTRRDFSEDDRRFEPFATEEPRYRSSPGPYYQPSSYHGPVHKKKATEDISIILNPSLTVGCDAGLTV